MCILTIKNNNKVISKEIALRSILINQHGYSVNWLDTGELERTMSPLKALEWMSSNRPYVFHARLATAGTIKIENTHPFSIPGTSAFLYQNGTEYIDKEKDQCDTEAIAQLLSSFDDPMKNESIETMFSMLDSRFAMVDGKNFRVLNKEKYIKYKKTLYSKANVLSGELVFVYGTLKTGFSNNPVMGFSKKIGDATTKEKYRMVVNGLPFVLRGAGLGKHVQGELYIVDDKKTMEGIDALEGHPSFYKREKIDVKINIAGDEIIVPAWCYMVGKAYDSPTKTYHKKYSKAPDTTPQTRYGSLVAVRKSIDAYAPGDYLYFPTYAAWTTGDPEFLKKNSFDCYQDLVDDYGYDHQMLLVGYQQCAGLHDLKEISYYFFKEHTRAH